MNFKLWELTWYYSGYSETFQFGGMNVVLWVLRVISNSGCMNILRSISYLMWYSGRVISNMEFGTLGSLRYFKFWECVVGSLSAFGACVDLVSYTGTKSDFICRQQEVL